jgi:hypothetical protein
MTDVVARLIKLKPDVMENLEAWKNAGYINQLTNLKPEIF